LKLINKTNLYTYATAFVVFIAGSLLFFYMLGKIVSNEANEKLLNEKIELSNTLATFQDIPAGIIPVGDKFEFRRIPVRSDINYVHFIDTLIYSKEEHEELPYRKISFYQHLTNADYRISISTTLFESEDLIKAILKSVLLILSALLIGMLLINRLISKRLWRPFYHTLELLKNYKIDRHITLQFTKSDTQEFDELNEALARMTDKISQDYTSLKDFSENASHEIQTPLAIIKSKLELLMQSSELSPSQTSLIAEVYEGSNRLSRLNHALILLTRIGNNQFAETVPVKMLELFRNKFLAFEELLAHKQLSVSENFHADPVWMLNPGLADILVSNLISNAIRHNHKAGKISLEILQDEIIISNTGITPVTAPELLFERFRKENPSSESLGLGLAIVKQICDSAHIALSYKYSGDLHQIYLKFTPPIVDL
jgi:signal transduction histidine kinase